MITSYTLSENTWTAISSAGETGSCWLSELQEAHTKDIQVLVYHGTSVPDETNLVDGKRVFASQSNNDVLVIPPDGETDIYYAYAYNCDSPIIVVDIT